MARYLFPVDIGNRTLQHCGVPLMDPAAGFNENSERANHVGFAYDKVRRAELRRNVWDFATKEAVLRAIDTNTVLLSPSLWSSGATYFVGSIVADQFGLLWISRIPSNIGFDLGTQSAWEPYFGPVTVQLYDSSVGYATGELVYTIAGDGTFNVFLSKVGSNALHPALPNLWSSSTVYEQNQVVVQYPAWGSGTTYAAGDTVLYTDNNVYTSLIAGNLNQIPTANIGVKWMLTPTLALKTQPVPISTVVRAPSTSPVSEWSIGTTYNLGSFVMFNGIEYVSIVNSNLGNFPNAAGSTSWKALTLGVLYMSLINFNLNNSPATTFAAPWSGVTTYSINQLVTGTDGFIYKSVGNGNLNNNPVLDNGTNWTATGVLSPWATSFTLGGGNSQWLQIGGSTFPFGVGLAQLNIVYPIGAGPSTDVITDNLYRLPAGYLMRAPQDPKAGSASVLGAPTELFYKDWKIEDSYLVSGETGPIWFRFVADFQDVSRMDDMFCEGLAASVAKEVVEILTQSTAKLQTITAAYDKAIVQARLVNAIQTGAVEPAMDDYLAARY